MIDIVIFLVFALAVVLCDIKTVKTREKGAAITTYCLLTAFALAVVISKGVGIDVPSPAKALEASLKIIKP